MNHVIDLYWARALKITRQYELGDVNFADLTGLSDEFAASFSEATNDASEADRSRCCSELDTKLTTAIHQNGEESLSAQALNELRMSINRTPIY